MEVKLIQVKNGHPKIAQQPTKSDASRFYTVVKDNSTGSYISRNGMRWKV